LIKLFFRGRLIVEVGASTGTLMAFDKRNGQTRWSSRVSQPAGHTAGPVPMFVEGNPCIAVLHLNGLLVARTDEGHGGETVAEYPWPTDYANNIASPTVRENHVLITSGYNQNKMANLRITLRGAEKVWEQGHVSQICTPVVHGGKIYWSWERMHCVDEETGALTWKGDSLGEAGSCIITSDDRLIIWTGRGTLTLVETAKRSPSAYQRLFQTQLLEQTDAWPHVVLADGRLFCKDRAGNLVCLSLRHER
jgi:outer membrane protein assembly factor BamB